MDEGNQILIPPSFLALYVPPGKLKPTLGASEMAARYELCEDMAQLLTEQAANQQFQLGITEDLALERCLQGLLATPEVVPAADAGTAQMVDSPMPIGMGADELRPSATGASMLRTTFTSGVS